MKKILIAVAAMLCATALIANAQDTQTTKKKPTAEQKALKKEMLEKYDTDKNGKLDKEERSKISAEDKEKMTKAGLLKSKKSAAAASSDSAPAK
jgi:Ni/Co efflux regulator RcnB